MCIPYYHRVSTMYLSRYPSPQSYRTVLLKRFTTNQTNHTPSLFTSCPTGWPLNILLCLVHFQGFHLKIVQEICDSQLRMQSQMCDYFLHLAAVNNSTTLLFSSDNYYFLFGTFYAPSSLVWFVNHISVHMFLGMTTNE